jgi:urease accessory protein
VLQLPRGAALAAGEWLAPEAGELRVRVEAAPERLLAVRSTEPLALMRAAYHLGNRHVALQLLPGELRLGEDPVLAHLLRRQGLEVESLTAAFEPEAGAYADGHPHGSGATA